jgi:hypothetical protein
LDDQKHEQFVEKVRSNQKRIWAERSETGKDFAIRSKISATLKIVNSLLTEDELKEKYGWLNKFTEEEKETWKQQVMFQTGMHKFWRNATEEEKRRVVIKKMSTQFFNASELINEYHISKEWKAYENAVRYLTEMTYHRHKEKIDPFCKRGDEFHLDHQFSVKAGFLLGIDPKIISHSENLMILSKKENLSKGAKCYIDIDTLLENIQNG